MWLSPNGNLRVDYLGNGQFRMLRWNQETENWDNTGTSGSQAKVYNYIKDMHMTEYPDVPDYPPETNQQTN